MKHALLIALLLAGRFSFAEPSYLTKSYTASGQSITMAISMRENVAIQVNTAFTATLQVLGSIDGSTFQTLPIFSVTDGGIKTGIASSGLYTLSAGGLRYLSLSCTAYTSGTPAAYISSSQGISSLVPTGSIWLSNTAQAWTTTNLPLNLTHAAGISTSLDVWVGHSGTCNGAVLSYAITNSNSTPNAFKTLTLTSGVMPFLLGNNAPGSHLHAKTSATCIGSIDIGTRGQ